MKLNKEEKEFIVSIRKSKLSKEQKDKLLNLVKINRVVMDTILSKLNI